MTFALNIWIHIPPSRWQRDVLRFFSNTSQLCRFAAITSWPSLVVAMVEEVTAYKINNEYFEFFFCISHFGFWILPWWIKVTKMRRGHSSIHPAMLKRIHFCLVILRWLKALKSPTREFLKTMENLQMPRDKKSKIEITSLRIPQYRGYYDCFYNLKGSSYIWCNKVNQDLRQFLMDRKEKPIVARLRNNLVNHTDLSLKQRTAPIYAEL